MEKENKQKMKKLLALALALVMVLSIAGCGSKDNNSTGGQTDTPSNTDSSNTGGDAAQTADGVGRYTYTAVSADPNTWSPTDWVNSEEGDYWSWCVTWLWDYMINDTGDGYKIVSTGATELPIDVTASLTAEQKALYGLPADAAEGYAWQIELNDQLCWEDGQKITADDYIYTLQQFLNPEMSNYRASQWYSGTTAIANAKAYYNSNHAGEIGFVSSLGDLGYASVEEAQADGYTEFGVDMDDFWGISEAGIVSITDETEYRDDYVEDESDPEAYVSGKYLYETYLAPGCDYESYTADEVYVGEVLEAATWDQVGVIKNGDYSFTVVLSYPQTPFYAVYGLQGLVCVREDLYEANKQKTGDIVKSSYGTSPDKFMSYGPYKLTTYQADKELRFTKNENWWGYSSEIYEGMYQTTDINYLIMNDHATEMNLFLQGNLSAQGLTSDDMATYGSSDYIYFTPETYTWKWSFTTDLEKLKSEETSGENHSILHYQDFREAISWAVDRQDYTASCTAAGLPSFGLLSDVYVCDPDTGETYRSNQYAEAALCRVYGASSVDQITGYDVAKASALLQSAYDQCLADGNISDTDRVVLDFHQYGSDDFYVKITNFVQAALDKAAVGTSLEGRITINLVEDPDYYDNMKNGLCDISMPGWGGSDMDPYAMMECWCVSGVLLEPYGFDPYTETTTITVNGEEMTKTFNAWYEALCMGEYVNASTDTRNQILAGMEEGMLKLYFTIPIYDANYATLYSQRIVLGSEEYINSLVGRGGVAAMTYTMDDAEWSAYCASQNNQLTY